MVLLSEHEEGLRQRQLAEQMRISPYTLSKLEADGYLIRGGHLMAGQGTSLTIHRCTERRGCR